MSSIASPNETIARTPDLPERLAIALRARRGRREEGRQFAPELSYGRHFGPAPATARAAAVIALLFMRDGHWHVPLTQRPAMLRHGGQISLPGGAVESGETTDAAARRELYEELGIDEPYAMLGHLHPSYVYASNFAVTPWIAATRGVPTWRPHKDEVERVVELPLQVLFDDEAVCTSTIQRGPIVFRAAGYTYRNDCIWGATAIILSELAGVLREL